MNKEILEVDESNKSLEVIISTGLIKFNGITIPKSN